MIGLVGATSTPTSLATTEPTTTTELNTPALLFYGGAAIAAGMAFFGTGTVRTVGWVALIGAAAVAVFGLSVIQAG